MYVHTHRLRLLPALVFNNVPHPTPHQGSGERRGEACKSERMESGLGTAIEFVNSEQLRSQAQDPHKIGAVKTLA